jgi:anaphase-promoting complex subunit 8
MGSLGSPSATAMASDLELNWDPEAIRSELHTATIVLSQRCLKLAAKWASEQLLGLPTSPWSSRSNNKSNDGQQKLEVTLDQSLIAVVLQETDPSVLYAKSLMELGEYMHAAATLSLPNPIVTTMAAQLPHLSSYGIFLRAYALFMAGERRKEEDYIELQR